MLTVLLKILVYRLTYPCLKFFTDIIDFFIYTWWNVNINCARVYEESAQVRKVRFCYKPPDGYGEMKSKDFISTHLDFVHPDIILNDNISLYTVNEKEAIFTDSADVDVFDPKNGAFIFLAQQKNAQRVIHLPLSSFFRISQNIEVPAIPIVCMSNHGRCGSTLMTKMFAAIRHSISMSEPHVINNIAEFSRQGRLKGEELNNFCSTSLRCLLKHGNARKSSVIFFKLTVSCTCISHLLHEALPQIKLVFMYRQPLPVVRSFEKIFAVNGWRFTAEHCKRTAGIGVHEMMKGYPNYPEEFLAGLSLFSRIALMWIFSVSSFNKFVSKGVTIRSLKYEDLLLDPKNIMLALFRFAGIPESYLPDISSVMAKDSQAGTRLAASPHRNKAFKLIPITDALKKKVNSLCHEYDVPLFWDNVELANKIQDC